MMSDSFIQNLFAERIGGAQYGKVSTVYKFAKIKRAKNQAKADNPTISLIDMGVGESDAMAYPQVIKAAQQAMEKPENRGYADNGGPLFRQAVAEYMQRTFHVSLDPKTEVIHSMGSKAALSILPGCFINPGDVTLTTAPGYPIFATHAKYYGGEEYTLPLYQENQFLPDLDSIPADICRRAKVLVLNYPNNPTGACVTSDFFARAIDFAQKNSIIIVQDAAYSAVVFSGEPLSILKIPGGKDVAVELHSLSKGYNMTGWRLGWVCGNPLIVKAYGDMKDNTDSGQFLAIQEAGATALRQPAITQEIVEKYSRRLTKLANVLRSVGFQASKPDATFFLYTKAPKAVKQDGVTTFFASAEEFSQWLILNHIICTVPWDDAGHYVRFSATFAAKDESEEDKMLQEIHQRLSRDAFLF